MAMQAWHRLLVTFSRCLPGPEIWGELGTQSLPSTVRCSEALLSTRPASSHGSQSGDWKALGAAGTGNQQLVPSHLLRSSSGEGLPTPWLGPASQANWPYLGRSRLDRIQEAKPRSGPNLAGLA